jgi:hypothetical protein
MKLSTLYTAVPEYIEFGWVTAPNAAVQSIPANTITTLTLNTEVADSGNLVSTPTNNQFTLPSGTYYFEAISTLFAYFGFGGGTMIGNILLRNISDSIHERRSKVFISDFNSGDKYSSIDLFLSSNFTINSSKTIELNAFSNT